MKLNFLGICIGNTCTQMGVFLDGKMTDRHTLANDDLDQLMAQLDQALMALGQSHGAAVVLASVKQQISQHIVAHLRKRPQVPVYRVEEDLSIPIGRQLDQKAVVGDDRLLNAAGAYDVLQQACVVVDAGTALTVDFVDGAGTYHGGAIAPGAQMMLAMLHDHTAQLPEVEWKRPAEAIGHNTVEAMRSGAFHGLRGMVRELVEQYAQVAEAYPIVVATGGDAEQLFDGYDLVDRIVPELELRGIEATVREALQSDRSSVGGGAD